MYRTYDIVLVDLCTYGGRDIAFSVIKCICKAGIMVIDLCYYGVYIVYPGTILGTCTCVYMCNHVYSLTCMYMYLNMHTRVHTYNIVNTLYSSSQMNFVNIWTSGKSQ